MIADFTAEIKSKEKSFWNEEATKKFSNYMKQLKFLTQATTDSVNVYFNTFLMHIQKTRLMTSVNEISVRLIKQMSAFLECTEKTFIKQLSGKLADQDSDASEDENECEEIEDCTLFSYDVC